MTNRHDEIAQQAPDLAEALTPEEHAALAEALADPESAPNLRAALAQWAALRGHLRQRLDRDLPDAELLTLYALGDESEALTPAETERLDSARAGVDAALAEHPGLEAEVARLRADRDAFYAMWEEEPRPAVNGAPRRRAAERPARRAPLRERRPSNARRWVWRGATAVALALFVALAVTLLQRDVGFETVQTAAGETRSVALPDGSVAYLAPQSRMEYRVAEGGERRVRLAGEAAFEVARAAEPFVVETPMAWAIVLGTTLGVRSDSRMTEVVLASGTVDLAARAAPEEPVRLEPGQRSRVVDGRPPEAPMQAEVTERLSWTGTWYFQDEPLEAIARRLSTHYNVEIAVPPALAGERLDGTFRQEDDLRQTLHTLAAALGVRVEGDAATGFRFVPAAN